MSAQKVILTADSIEEKIQEYLVYGLNYQTHSKIYSEEIKTNLPIVWRECHLALPGTYVYLGQYPSAILYGLYKCDNNHIYIVKSFMDTVMHVVPFHRKYFG